MDAEARVFPCLMRCVLAALAAVTVALAAPGQLAQAATYSKVVRYGPFTIPAATDAGAAMQTNVRLAVARPCLECYITSFTPDLVYPDGQRATMENGAMLHHAVFASQFRSDATCNGTPLGLAGERFFASGDERSQVAFPYGYGYRVRWYDVWNTLVELMNHETTAKTVYLQLTYTYRPVWESVRTVKPVWLDIDQCGDSEYSIDPVWDEATWDWPVNVPGKVVFAVGHVHGHGVAVEAVNLTQGRSICRSNATLDPMDVHRVLAMSSCSGDPLAVVQQGETVRLYSWYQSAHPANDVMGIMLMYVNPG